MVLQPPATQPAQPTFDINTAEFDFNSGDGVLSPRDLIRLPRPGGAKVNPGADLAVIPVALYDAEAHKYENPVETLIC